ncbi:hypothetical protein DFS34DRAFT_646872 [Phlyctochytrium arcticum]|nr:hypothetical protein DFS34DRAFT_646872 [Phlyctochytrium arcticum]
MPMLADVTASSRPSGSGAAASLPLAASFWNAFSSVPPLNMLLHLLRALWQHPSFACVIRRSLWYCNLSAAKITAQHKAEGLLAALQHPAVGVQQIQQTDLTIEEKKTILALLYAASLLQADNVCHILDFYRHKVLASLDMHGMATSDVFNQLRYISRAKKVKVFDADKWLRVTRKAYKLVRDLCTVKDGNNKYKGKGKGKRPFRSGS